jgi:hypothetical protein
VPVEFTLPVGLLEVIDLPGEMAVKVVIATSLRPVVLLLAKVPFADQCRAITGMLESAGEVRSSAGRPNWLDD